MYVDSSSGVLGNDLAYLMEVYARACRAAPPRPAGLAAWLVKLVCDGPGWPDVVEREWAPALGAKGLAEVARARLGRTTSNTELSTVMARRTATSPFDFERADERAAMGHLLGLIVERDRPITGHMISALVNYLDANDAGPGFYTLAKQLGYPVGNSPTARMDFWIGQLNAVMQHYGGHRTSS